MNDTIQTLFQRRDEIITAYPESISRMEGMLLGTAFFPGGQGLFIENPQHEPEFPFGKIMVLGQDFDNATGFRDTIQKGVYDELDSKTWIYMRPLFEHAEINLYDCFFTNAIMGVRNTEGNIGTSPAFNSPEFLQQCRQFFIHQLTIQKPKLVIVLGKNVARFLMPISGDFNAWKPCELSYFRQRQNWILNNVSFESIPEYSARFLFLIHPSMLNSNVKRITYGTISGKDAVHLLLRNAKAGLDL
ncbi:MAG: hypothetical protein ACD_79C01444G0001 [uncultured bacterium]|nr:MAG: hypothetical protein ACD_79C01444G0001 [uncultured bacterium]